MVFSFIQNIIDEARKRKQEKEEKIHNYLESIDDEIVKKCSFLPLKNGGSSFQTHNFTTDSFGNIVFQVKIWFPMIFIGAFSIPLIATLIKFAGQIINNELVYNLDTFSNYFGEILFSGILSGVIIILFYFIFRSKIFDFQNGYFYELRNQKKLFKLLNNEKYKSKIVQCFLLPRPKGSGL